MEREREKQKRKRERKRERERELMENNDGDDGCDKLFFVAA
jgi:hypothetical protein